MVHRDIKPANLILASAGNKAIVKVLDFGLAKVHSEGQVDPSLTRAGQMLGTPDYIAPEQIRDSQSADIRADIYSLGCSLYCLLSGGPPFGGTNLWDIYQAHFSMDASPLHGVRPGVSVELAALVSKMMAKDPGHRFQTPGEVAQALTPFFLIGTPGSMASKPQASSAVPPRTEPARPVAARGAAQPPTASAAAPPPLPRDPVQPKSVPVRPAVERSLAPPPLPKNSVQPTSSGTILGGLTDLREPEAPSGGSSVKLRPPIARKPNRFGPRAWWAAAAVLVPGLVALWAASRPTPPPGRTTAPSITNTIGMRFALIPAGSFLMGSPAKDALPGEKRPHREWIARPFYLGIHEVTRGQFRRFVEETGHTTDAEKDGHGGSGIDEKSGARAQNPRYTWLDPGFHQTDEHPVVNVSWNDAVAFAAWLSRKEGRRYRLPTEAEWEYACRAGSTARFWFGDNPEGLAAGGNISDGTARAKYPDWPGIAARDGYVYTASTGRFQPNPWGLCDMHGNVWEWCSDEYDDGYYALTPEDNPPTSSGARARGIRGGSWQDEPRRCRSSAALRHLRVDRSFSIGFRLVLVPP
jgi:formylglycine-generating enzyme required for sulfatase activity